MSNNSNCYKCDAKFTDNNILKCFGDCDKVLHYACSPLSISNAKLCNNTSNFEFVCDDCLQKHRNLKFTMQSLTSQLNEAKNLLSKLFVNFQSLSSNQLMGSLANQSVSANTATGSHHDTNYDKGAARDHQIVNNDKRFTRSTTKKLYNVDETPSTPITPKPTTSQQFNQNEIIVGTCSIGNDEIKSVPAKKYIYASRFANSTSQDALKKFLCSKLSLSEDEIECRLLVPANIDVSRLNFISFKVGVDPDTFNMLLKPDSWPAGVLVREFIRRAKNFVPAEIL